jgi:signal transduction histidine kinase
MSDHDRLQPELEEALVALGKPLALAGVVPGVIHELNNPLFAVLGLLEFLVAEAEAGTKTHERLTLVQKSALEIKELVRTVLDFAREREDGEGVQDVQEAAEEAALLFRRTSSARDVETEVVAGPGKLAVVASRSRLKQIFLALLTNAQQAMPRGGTVTVSIERVDRTVVASVADTGEGIEADAVPRIFEPFFTTRADTGACGVGLTVARGMARRCGGELTLERTDPCGSTFALRLPAA